MMHSPSSRSGHQNTHSPSRSAYQNTHSPTRSTLQNTHSPTRSTLQNTYSPSRSGDQNTRSLSKDSDESSDEFNEGLLERTMELVDVGDGGGGGGSGTSSGRTVVHVEDGSMHGTTLFDEDELTQLTSKRLKILVQDSSSLASELNDT